MLSCSVLLSCAVWVSKVTRMRVEHGGPAMYVQEVDRVVARLRARENEQHDALGPVQTFVNLHMQASLLCLLCQAVQSDHARTLLQNNICIIHSSVAAKCGFTCDS